MRKIFSIIILFIITWSTNCYGAVYYDDYQLIQEDTNEFYEETDTLRREENFYYNNYYYERINSDYYLEGDNPDIAPYIDYENYQTEKITDLTYFPGATSVNGLLKLYNNIQLRYFLIGEFSGVNEKLNQLQVYIEDEKIDYQIIEQNYTFGDVLTLESYFIVDLGDIYYLKDLKFEMEINSENNNYSYAYFKSYLDYLSASNYSINIRIYQTGGTINNLFGFLPESEFNDFYELIAPDESIKSYCYYYVGTQRKYLYYDLVEVSTDIYSLNPIPNHNHDLNKFKVSYNYYERNKIEIPDIITSYQEELISSSTIPLEELIINHNINFEENGDYLVEVYFNDVLLFTHTLIVNITQPEYIPPVEPEPLPNEENNDSDEIHEEETINPEEIPEEKTNSVEESDENHSDESLKADLPSVLEPEKESIEILSTVPLYTKQNKSLNPTLHNSNQSDETIAYNQLDNKNNSELLNETINLNKNNYYPYLLWGLPIMLSFLLIKLKKKN